MHNNSVLSAKMNLDKPICSVVIPTKNAGILFTKVIEALVKQTLWQQTELIIIDSGSEDTTVELAKQIGAKVFTIPASEFNHGLTRDYGISLANSDNIILLVQDAVPVDNYLLQTLVNGLTNEKVAGVYARQIPRPDADILTKRNLNNWLTGRTEQETRYIKDMACYQALSPIDKYQFCNFDNVCSAIKKSIWQHIPFGKVNFGEDIDWAERVLKQGYHIVYEPQAAVIHSHDRPISYEYKRTYVCHRKLYAMFALHTVPSIRALWRSWLYSCITDIKYVVFHEPKWKEKLRLLLKIPILNLFSIIAQYQAVRDEIAGVNHITKGV